jgi:hypothetical protein
MIEFQNLGQAIEHIQSIVASVNFDSSCRDGGQLGWVCAEYIAAAIRDRSYKTQGSRHGAWPANSPLYADWKIQHYGHDITNVRTDHMLSHDSLRGTVDINGNEMTMTYGLGTYSPRPRVKDDRRRTDREKAVYAHGQYRQFYNITPEVSKPAVDAVRRAVADHVRERTM